MIAPSPVPSLVTIPAAAAAAAAVAGGDTSGAGDGVVVASAPAVVAATQSAPDAPGRPGATRCSWMTMVPSSVEEDAVRAPGSGRHRATR
uniref:Putative serine/threonine-protein kinase tousled-like 2 n=1 Tax=Anopheles triannulatus TaxID=58253 RepID=A0A2M4B4I0_9DIPT